MFLDFNQFGILLFELQDNYFREHFSMATSAESFRVFLKTNSFGTNFQTYFFLEFPFIEYIKLGNQFNYKK